MSSPIDLSEAEAFIEGLGRTAADMVRRSRAAEQALAEAGGTAEDEYARMRVDPSGRILDIAFSDNASTASPVQLGDRVMQLYRQAGRQSHEAALQAAEALEDPRVTQMVRRSAPGQDRPGQNRGAR